MREKIEALLVGETKQVSFRVPQKLLRVLEPCGKKIYGPLPDRGALTTYALYFLARGVVDFMEEERKKGQPIIEVDIDNTDKGGEVRLRKSRRGD